MPYIPSIELTDNERTDLQHAARHSRLPNERARAQCILMYAEGYLTKDIASILGMNKQTLSRWRKRWATEKMALILEGERTGRPAMITPEVEAIIPGWCQAEPLSLGMIRQRLSKEHQVNVCDVTIANLLHRNNYRYKRTRSSLKKDGMKNGFAPLNLR